MTKKKRYLFTVMFFMISTFFLAQQKSLAAEGEKKYVLILNSYNESFQWTGEIVQSIKESIKYNKEKLFIDIEYMDGKRKWSEEYYGKLYEFYKYKYNDRKYDVIICSDNDALNFLLKYRESLFPKTPVVFCGINNFSEDSIKGKTLYTGIVENLDFKNTIDAALRLNPRVKKVIVLADTTTTGMQEVLQLHKVIPNYKNLDFMFYYCSNMSDIKKTLSSAEKDTVVLLMGIIEESHGKYIPSKEFAEIVAKYSPVPVYTLWEFNLNTGVLGGAITSGKYQGEKAGGLAGEILKGQSIKNLPIIRESESRYMFDYNAMRKFNIKAQDLPTSSIIVGKPSTRYNIPKTYVLYGLLVLIIISIIGNYVLVFNIAERKKSEYLLREREEQYRKLFELSPDAILVNKDGIIKLANKASLRLFGVESYDQLLEKSLADFIPSSIGNPHQLRKIDNNYNSTVLREGKIMRKNGTIIDVEISTTSFPYKGENMVLTVERDITDSKRLLETLEYDKIKTEFFSNISHELRTPLNVLLSAIQLWELYHRKGEEFDKKGYKYIDIMKQNCFRLLRLISNLIDITKVDSNYIQPNFERRNIVSLVEDITLSVADYIEDKNIKLIFDTEVEEKFLFCDSDKIERIVLNLLSNAVKFTNPGDFICVNIYDKVDYITISVKDTGIGIPEDKLQIIFERFKQVDKSLSRNREGSGIGLSLVKAFVEMHGGRVSVKSSYGSGSEFIIELPVTELAEEECAVAFEENSSKNFDERVTIEFSDIYKE